LCDDIKKNRDCPRNKMVHLCHPLNVYCRLADRIRLSFAYTLCKFYEKTAWKVVLRLIHLIPEKEEHYNA
jgi:hypothetical protein